MNTMVTTENFPTELCSREAKEQFARAVLKERANKRKLQVALITIILTIGVIYVELFPGNGARVFPPLERSPWIRVCSATGPTGALKSTKAPIIKN